MLRLPCAFIALTIGVVALVGCGDLQEDSETAPNHTATAHALETLFPEDPNRTPVRIPTYTPAPLLPTPFPVYTPVPLTPTPASVARPDCPDGWAVIDDPLFSVCYPVDWRATDQPAPPGPGFDRVVEIFIDRPFAHVGFSVTDRTPLSEKLFADMTELCAHQSQNSGIAVGVERITIASGELLACVGHGDAGSEGFDPVRAYPDLRDGRFLQIAVTLESIDAQVKSVASSILQTLLLK